MPLELPIELPTQDHPLHRRLRPVLVWSGLTLLAALAIALALELGTDPDPLPSPPMQIGSPSGHATAQ